MNKDNVLAEDGGQAFPAAFTVGPNDDLYPPNPGMTLRDYFAAQAMIGIMSTAGGFDRADRRHDMVAEQAFKFADAMLAERQA